MSDLIHEECWTCDGTGKVRNNKSEDGKYVFAKTQCHECCGSGMLDYLKCKDCGAVVPASCFDDHECSD